MEICYWEMRVNIRVMDTVWNHDCELRATESFKRSLPDRTEPSYVMTWWLDYWYQKIDRNTSISLNENITPKGKKLREYEKNRELQKQPESKYKMAISTSISKGFPSSLGTSPGGGTATHSSILAWEIPWMEEPDRLSSMGL